VTEKYITDGELELEPLQEIPTSGETKDSDVEEELNPLLYRDTEIKAEWDNRSNNPLNKPLDDSVTEQYYTEGGKEIRAVHDTERSFWHVEFTSGGTLPSSLAGKFTAEDRARNAIKQYLAKSE
jgi:hypothetical protein